MYRRVTMSEASNLASDISLSVKTLPRRPNDYIHSSSSTDGASEREAVNHNNISPANKQQANQMTYYNTIIASDGKEYSVAPLCLPPPSEIASFLREMKVKRDQGYFRMTPPV